MTPETEGFLALVRRAEEPSQEDEQRVLRALQASVTAGLTTSVAVRAGRSDAWLSPAGKSLMSTIAKLSLVAVGTTMGLSIGRSPTLPQPSTSSAVASPAPERTAARAHPAAGRPPVAPALPPAAPALSPRSASSARLPARGRSAHVASLRSELNVLERAQRALKEGDGEAALRELDAAATSDGPLRAERQAARILALCSAGRASEARAAITRFFQEYPESAHRAAILSGCANFATD